MSDKNMFDEAFPQDKQIGEPIYFLKFKVEFIAKNDLSFL